LLTAQCDSIFAVEMKKNIYRKFRLFSMLAASSLLVGIISSHKNDEGMFPLNYLSESALQKAGLKMNIKDIFNPGEVALASALVKVGGCTGSFISPEGLVITNHHCVYGGVASLSTPENDYLENGFVAKTKNDELPINMPCRITESYEDVSSRVLQGIGTSTDPATRAQIIAANIQSIVEEEKTKNPELSPEVSEMFVGRSYMLFRYFTITDVRLVFAPPVSIGQFGGDLDNWEWPRHNGDFSMVRAYVGPDGKPAKYSKNNIPFKPKRHLQLNTKGTKEGDFVFILGYPGRTFRHESAPYLKFQQEKQLPLIQNWYSWYIKQMRDLSEGDNAKFLAFAGEIQSLENVEKNYRGKMQGLTRTNMVNEKWADEEAMQSKLLSEIGLSDTSKHQNTQAIPAIRKIWSRKTELASDRYTFMFLLNQSNPYYLAHQTLRYREMLKSNKNEAQRKQLIKDFVRTVQSGYSIIDKKLEKEVLKKLLPKINQYYSIKDIDKHVEQVLSKDKLFDTAYVFGALRKNPEKLISYNGPLMEVAKKMLPVINNTEAEWGAMDQQLKALMPSYLDIKQHYKEGQFIPDANSTLRLTYGYIKRYRPNDAEVHLPYTTLDGVFEKANTANDYRLPKNVADNLRIKEVPSILKDEETGAVIVAFLYNLDTTGGNSGSPVLDAYGRLIGINFDRSFTATINDYGWNDKYSRSIGCDIRYVLFVMKYVGKADHLLTEMGVSF
jgi:hypothetical protein